MRAATPARRKTATRSHAERRLAAATAIVQAAFDIVARRGVDQVTLAEAGEEAGYSRALAAHYFDSKEALLAAVAEHAIEKYQERLKAAEPVHPGREALLASVAFYFNETRKWPKRLRAYFEVTNAALRWPAIAPTVAQLNAGMIERTAGHIRAAQEKGEVRGDLDPDAEAIALSGAMRGIMGQWLIDSDAVDLDAVRDNFIAGLRRSWMAPK